MTSHQPLSARPPAIDLSVFVNKAVGVHHTDTTDAAWDGPANEARLPSPLPVDVARRAYAWLDNSQIKDGEIAKEYASFIHHVVSGGGDPGAADIKACQTGIGVLNGGMMAPGANAPWKGDRQGIYNHLAAHLRDAGLEPAPLDMLPRNAMPTPNEGEGHDQFVQRCMDEMAGEMPDEGDRQQMCEMQWQEEGGGAPMPMQPMQRARKRQERAWYRFENAADGADVFLYDEITDPFSSAMGGGISALGFARDLQGLRGKALNVHVNSPGGSVFEGLAVYNLLRQHDGPVNVIVDGIAASIASVIAMAGDSVTMSPHALMMIHDASGLTIGNADDHRQQANVLDKLSEDIAAVYRERGDSRRNWRGLMKAETWLTAEEAVSMGLADRIGEPATAPTNHFDLSRYRNVPASLTAQADEAHPDRSLTKREIEDALRDAGLSSSKAKAFVSEGWKVMASAETADADPEEPESDAPSDETAAIATGTVDGAAETDQEARARTLEMMALLL